MKRLGHMGVFVLLAFGLLSSGIGAEEQGSVAARMNAYLAETSIPQGVETLSKELRASPVNDDLRFALGFLQFANAVQNLGRSWYQYGLRSQNEVARAIPFLRLPVPVNPAPKPVTNEQARRVLEQFINDLMDTEATLSGIKNDDASLEVQLGRAYLDFDNDGEGKDEEALWLIYAHLNQRANITPEQAAGFLIKLDAGDVYWLRAYCHFMSAMLEFYLAHDDSQLFDHTAHLFFAEPKTPYPFLKPGCTQDHDFIPLILDSIAFIHLIDLPVTDANRSRAALDHLNQMIQLSRKSWALYEKETDDDREWIPNPRQTGVVPGVKVTEEMIQQWFAFLDEAEKLLAGEVLIPFWRGDKPLGVNLQRVFTKPEQFDLVLWVQGTAAAPYLEEGELTDAEFWNRLMDAFNGRFVGFALWFN